MKKPEEIKKGLECCIGDPESYHCDRCPYETEDEDDESCMLMLTGDALALIHQLEAQVPRWISVEEPPKVAGTYWVRLTYPSGRVWKTWNLFHPAHGWCKVDEYMNSTLTHWMEFESLPEAPKEDAHEQSD